MRKSGRNVNSLFGGNRNNGSSSGSRYSNWNNAPSNSNWNIGLRASCDDLCNTYRGGHGDRDRPAFLGGQHILAGFGKHTARFG
jgi:hypothetical protein